jgi:hypothetical protein
MPIPDSQHVIYHYVQLELIQSRGYSVIDLQTNIQTSLRISIICI